MHCPGRECQGGIRGVRHHGPGSGRCGAASGFPAGIFPGGTGENSAQAGYGSRGTLARGFLVRGLRRGGTGFWGGGRAGDSQAGGRDRGSRIPQPSAGGASRCGEIHDCQKNSWDYACPYPVGEPGSHIHCQCGRAYGRREDAGDQEAFLQPASYDYPDSPGGRQPCPQARGGFFGPQGSAVFGRIAGIQERSPGQSSTAIGGAPGAYCKNRRKCHVSQ